MAEIFALLKAVASDVLLFSEGCGGVRLRRYQQAVAQVVVDAVLERKGLSIVVVFPRQSGKNELQAQIEAYLLLLFSARGADLVKISPTWKPQSQNAMQRLERALRNNLLTRRLWTKEHGYIYRIGEARITFLSGQPGAHIVGATANKLLEIDEAQDVPVEKYDKEVAPMAASSNATRLFWGTAWTADTLLGRELRAARLAEAEDGRRRVFVLDADQVAAEVPEYAAFVSEQVRRFGRQHPLVRTQFYSEEIERDAGLFTPRLRALLQGEHPALENPHQDALYAVLIDVGGQQFTNQPAWQQAQYSLPLETEKQDLTAATVVEVDLGTLADPLIQAPSYRVVQRHTWQGTPHSQLYGQLRALAEHWQARYMVIDATGLGMSLASFLGKALGEQRLLPFVFTLKSKSDLGWAFLAAIEAGRFKDYRAVPGVEPGSGEASRLQAQFQLQLQYCQAELLPGPGRLMRWGVPDGQRDPLSGRLVHDDLLVSAALCATLDRLSWAAGSSVVLAGEDILAGLGEVY